MIMMMTMVVTAMMMMMKMMIMMMMMMMMMNGTSYAKGENFCRLLNPVAPLESSLKTDDELEMLRVQV